MSVEEVEFRSENGETLRGRLHLPEGGSPDGPCAGVVMTHGFSAVIDMALPHYAEAFCDAGMAVLVYDHQRLGASDGAPRQQINPWLQMADMRTALGWLGDHREVDADRLGLWGSSFSGGEVIILAALDERVRAAVISVPYAGMPGENYDVDTSGRVAEIADALATGTLAFDDEPAVMGPFTVVEDPDSDLSPFLGQPESRDWFLAEGAGTTWRNEVSLANAFGIDTPFDPGVCAAHLGCPTLWVIADDDRVAATDVAVAAFERAPDPKRLVMLDGHHFAPYSGDSRDRATAAEVAWFAEHLGPTG